MQLHWPKSALPWDWRHRTFGWCWCAEGPTWHSTGQSPHHKVTRSSSVNRSATLGPRLSPASITTTTSKHRQSNRHADPRRQQQHTAIAARVTRNRATMTVFITVWPSPFDLWVNACRATATEYTCTMFGVKAVFQTDRQTKCYSRWTTI